MAFAAEVGRLLLKISLCISDRLIVNARPYLLTQKSRTRKALRSPMSSSILGEKTLD
jgi:hypothetical protein